MKAENISNKKSSTQTSKELYWRQHIEACKTSGLSKAIYCKEKQLNYSRLMYWQKKLKEDNKISFVPAKIKQAPILLKDKLLCTLDLPNGSSLKIHEQAALEIIMEKLK